MRIQRRTVDPGWFVLLASLGGMLTLVGTYWDDAWHTDRGRDSFFAAPHLALYAGVFVALVGVSLAGRTISGRGRAMAASGAIAVLVSAPIDEAWHALFGRDAVLWSPPHMLAVAASVLLASGVLMLAADVVGRVGVVARALAAAGVIGALQVPVLEYDSDVPQFATVWYLPVAVLGWLIAVQIIRNVMRNTHGLLVAAATYTAARIGVVFLLVGLDHSLTVIPPVLLLAVLHLLIDRAPVAQRWRLPVEAVACTLVWFGWLEVVGGAAASLTNSDLFFGLAVTAVAATAVSMWTPRWQARSGVAAATSLLVLGVLSAPAFAHDPGQGPLRRDARIEAQRTSGTMVAIELEVPRPCGDLDPVRTVARRSGDVVIGPLQRSTSPCRFLGSVDAAPTGRWFIYAELDSPDGRIETWVALDDSITSTSVDRALYSPPTGGRGAPRIVVAGVLYLAVALLVVWALVGSRMTAPRNASPDVT